MGLEDVRRSWGLMKGRQAGWRRTKSSSWRRVKPEAQEPLSQWRTRAEREMSFLGKPRRGQGIVAGLWVELLRC